MSVPRALLLLIILVAILSPATADAVSSDTGRIEPALRNWIDARPGTDEVTVWVNRAGQIRINENWVRPIDLAQVLKQELAKTSLKAVTIRGDEHVPYGTIVTVMDTAKLLGADITLAAEAEMQGPAQLPPQPAGG